MLAPVRPAVFVGARLLDGRSPDAIVDGVLVTDDQGRIADAGPGTMAALAASRRDNPIVSVQIRRFMFGNLQYVLLDGAGWRIWGPPPGRARPEVSGYVEPC